jgi:hypothetical protein
MLLIGMSENGSSICTPISSMPSSKKAMTVVIGTVAQPASSYSASGRKASQIIIKRLVCLRDQMIKAVLGA